MIKKKTKPEIKKEVVYALRHIESGKLLIMERTSNQGSDFCGESTVKLGHYYDDKDFNVNIWYVDKLFHAEFIRQNPTEWYNSGENCPDHEYEPEELEIVEIQREFKTIVHEVKIPTFPEYMKLRYYEKERAHYEYVIKEYESNPRRDRSWSYSLYELEMLKDEGKWIPEGEAKDESNKPKSKKT